MLNLYEKYKINNFNDFDSDIKKHYKNVIEIFKSLSKENLPNILLYGDSGSGKSSLLYSFFDGEKKIKKLHTYKTTSKTIQYIIYHSSNFIEIDLDELGIYKKYILRDIIKDFILTKKVINNKNKIIIIHNIHLLNIEDQFILRKIIEEHIINCRFILLSNTINNLLEPIKSRCLMIKTPGFTEKIIRNKLNNIIKEKKLNVKKKIINEIVKYSGTNLKKAILELNTYVNLNKLGLNDKYLEIKSENFNNIIIDLINNIKNKDINYKKSDDILYKLLINYKVESTIIIQKIFDLLKPKFTNKQLKLLIDLNYEYNIYLNNVSKKIIYLQSYIYNLHDIIRKK